MRGSLILRIKIFFLMIVFFPLFRAPNRKRMKRHNTFKKDLVKLRILEDRMLRCGCKYSPLDESKHEESCSSSK